MDSFQNRVARWTALETDRWLSLPALFPAHLETISAGEKREKERELETFLGRLPHTRREYEALTAVRRASLRMRLRTAIARALSPSAVDSAETFFEECETVAEDFVRKAEEFDPALREREIYQALRNQWVFNSIQRYLKRPVELTASSFAYSLLYPYTDNRLDGARGPGEGTAGFLAWLSRRLAGEPAGEADASVERIDRLLRMIETEYPRSAYSDVHAALRAIHSAQQKSLRLRGRFAPEEEVPLLAVSIEKGGTSVLADGLLATGSLADPAAYVVFAYGVLLQLVDDLQDLDEDGERGHSTVFTRAQERGPLDAVTNRLLDLLATSPAMMHEGERDALPTLVRRSCTVLILEAIARHRTSYSDPYVKRVEEFSPVRFEYLRELKGRVTRLV